MADSYAQYQMSNSNGPFTELAVMIRDGGCTCCKSRSADKEKARLLRHLTAERGRLADQQRKIDDIQMKLEAVEATSSPRSSE